MFSHKEDRNELRRMLDEGATVRELVLAYKTNRRVISALKTTATLIVLAIAAIAALKSLSLSPNPAVLLTEAGQPIPDDPYSPIVGANAPKDLRDHAKATLAAFLNSKSDNIEEPRDFDSARWGMTAEDFRAKVLEAFAMVPALMGTDKGLTLQRLESDMAEAIMLHFVRQGHAILPIHDAFIVQAPLERELVQVMQDTFKTRLGQVPPVKVTRSYALR